MQKTAKKKRNRRYTPRETRKFQLRLDDSSDLQVREILESARTQRREVTMIRNGVKLLSALENDDLSVLFELFPNLKGRFVPESASLIEQFRQMLLQHPAAIPEIPKLEPPTVGNPKSLPIPHIPMPTFDDEDTMVMEKDALSETRINTSFLDAAFGFQQGKND